MLSSKLIGNRKDRQARAGMKAASVSDSAGKGTWLKWVLYILVLIFAFDVLGIFLPIPYLGAVGVEYKVAGGLVVLVAMFVYLSLESGQRIAGLSRRLGSQVSNSDASIQSLRRNLEESNSEAKRRSAELDSRITKVGEAVAAIDGPLNRIQTKLSELAEKADKLGAGLSASRDDASGNSKSLSKALETGFATSREDASSNAKLLSRVLEAESGLKRQLDSLEETVGTVDEDAKRLEEISTKIDASRGETKAAVDEAGMTASKLEIATLELTKSLSQLEKVASVNGKNIDDIRKRSSAIEGRVSAIAKGEARIAKLEFGLAKINARLAKITEAETSLSRIERGVTRIGARGSGKPPAPKRRARRQRKARGRRPRTARAPKRKPAQPVPEQVRKLEEEMQEAQVPVAREEPQESQGRPQQ